MLGREGGTYGKMLQLDHCPGSAGSVPALQSDHVIDLTDMRPSSAPSNMESSSQVCLYACMHCFISMMR